MAENFVDSKLCDRTHEDLEKRVAKVEGELRSDVQGIHNEIKQIAKRPSWLVSWIISSLFAAVCVLFTVLMGKG